MASSSADWVRGVARLISSTSTSCANTGPGRNTKLDVPSRFDAVHLGARDVGGHEVGSALHARPLQPERRGERLGEMRLAEPGQAFHQHVAAGEDRRDDARDQVPLPDDDAIEGRADGIQLLLGPGERRLGGR